MTNRTQSTEWLAPLAADLAVAQVGGCPLVIRAADDLEIPPPIRALVTLATIRNPAPTSVAHLVAAVIAQAGEMYAEGEPLATFLEHHVDLLVERVVIGVGLGGERPRDQDVREAGPVERYRACELRPDIRRRQDLQITDDLVIVLLPTYGLGGAARLAIGVLALVVRHPETVDPRIVDELRGWTIRSCEAGRLAALSRAAGALPVN